MHNKNSVEEIYNFFKEKYGKIPSIGELNTMGIKPEMQEQFMKTYRNMYESLYQSENYSEIERDLFITSGSYQSVTLFLHQYSGFVFSDYNHLLYDMNPDRIVPTGTCLPFGKKMFVTVNGKILPCERIGHQYALGEITDSTVCLDFDAIAGKYNTYFSKLNQQCNKCHNKKACIQCVFNLNKLDENPICHGFMNKQDFERFVEHQMYFLEKHPDMYYKIMEEVIVEF